MPFVLYLFRAGRIVLRPAAAEEGLMVKLIRSALAIFALLVAGSCGALAQDSSRNEPGKFDFYILSLSWSPSYCAAAHERYARNEGIQCGARPFAFVVHGLWPQYEHGFPENCQVPAPRLYRGIVSSMLDVMPAPRLIYNEWDRHGTCSGLSPRAYFDTVRKARSAVKIPDKFVELQAPLDVTPAAVEEAFTKANPGLRSEGMAIECDHRRLTEVRICLSKELQFRDCPEIARRSCKRDQVVMPPVRNSAN
jgi:ribonuclease T2